MDFKQKCAVVIGFEEGKKLEVYKCSKGYLTCGIGHNIEASPTKPIIGRTVATYGTKISESECSALFNYDLDKVLKDLDKKLPRWAFMDEPTKLYFVTACFQLGINGLLKFKNTNAAIFAGKRRTAEAMLLASAWAKQTPNRIKRNAQLILGIIPKEYKIS